MLPLSIVILAKNEEKNIARTLQPLMDLSDDIILLDNGSTDSTIAIAEKLGAKIHHINWTGYADTKNRGNTEAKYDWILSLDADEEINEELKSEIIRIFSAPQENNQAWKLKRKMVYAGKILHHGSVSNEYRLRIFNRKNASWNSNVVHEDIELEDKIIVKKMKGHILHHSYESMQLHEKKIKQYAQLFVAQEKASNKKNPFYKKYFSPVFGFIKNYFFRFGFLDGKEGLQFALTEMKYTYLKYQ